MASEVVHSGPITETYLQSTHHPFAPLTAHETKYAGQLLRAVWPASTDIYFKAITLQEPLKAEALSFLEAEHAGAQLPHIARKAFVAYYLRRTVRHHHANLC